MEVLLGAEYYCSTDVWSTACLIFELATGDYLFDPHAGKNYSRDEDHLGHIIELLGNVPDTLRKTSKYGEKYFNEAGDLKRIPLLKPWGMDSVLTEKYDWERGEADRFISFLLPMLQFNPLTRISARDCLNSSWLVSSQQRGDEGVDS